MPNGRGRFVTMVTRSRVVATLVVVMLVTALGAGGAVAASSPAGRAAAAGAKPPQSAKQRAAAKKRAVARQRAAAKRELAARKKAKAKKAGIAPKATTQEIPVSFTVRNTNTSMIPCASDGKTYEVRGHLVGPADRLNGSTPQAVALYVHGLGYGEFFWNYKGVPGYDYATQQAVQFGQVSVVIDRLGYGTSGKPDGNQVCYGSEGDYLNQIVTQLRSGAYTASGEPARQTFSKVALVGHSAGGFMVEASALSYHNVDALIVAGFGNTGASITTYATFAQTTLDCYTAPLPNNYAYFGKTPADFKAGHFFNADPAVADAVTAIRAPDPCMDTGSAIQAIVVDALSNNSIKAPVLIVTGANDALFPPPAGDVEKLLFFGNADLTQVTLPGTGHAVTLGRTAPQFRSVVGGWLKHHGF
ncbi:MAG: hypothetical protein JWO02_1240 [Solirubrobacterales bacterium]|nr:hypothetical protein [Solirubrobacterales bacterium]